MMANKYERTDWYVTPYNSSYERYDTQGSAVRYEGPMPLASATFRVAGDEEFELQVKPGTGTGFKGVQEVEPGLYQAKNRKKGAGTGFISLPSTKSVLLAAWWYAKACKAREEGTLGSPSQHLPSKLSTRRLHEGAPWTQLTMDPSFLAC